MKDKILGLIFGQALGDAVGLITEFKFKIDEPEIEFPYTDSIRGWPVCDWTDDTDHMILLMESLTETTTAEVPKVFAQKLSNWRHHGFSDLGDTRGLGLGGNTNLVLNHPKYSSNPVAASREVWAASEGAIAANGAIMRTSILSAAKLSIAELMTLSRACCITTHYDARCIVSCWILNLVLYYILHSTSLSTIKGLVLTMILTHSSKLHKHWPGNVPAIEGRRAPTPKFYKNNVYIDQKNGQYKLDDEIRDIFKSAALDDLNLDEIGNIGYTMKCASCALWALDIISVTSKQVSFKKAILAIVRQCGDADTNAAVSGSILGAHLGYSKLPKDWLEALPNYKWLLEKAEAFIENSNVIAYEN